MRNIMFNLIWQALLASSVAALPSLSSRDSQPTVAVKNGTYTGIHLSDYNQDAFLGIPYAQPPVGDLRFSNPASLDSSWTGSRDAKSLSASCVGYGPSQLGYETSEASIILLYGLCMNDCLYLNVWRPSGRQHGKLPVVVWIHGGGYVQGAGSDLRYNLSFLVDQSKTIAHPVIGVSLNYRLRAWGFLNSKEFFETGSSNMGLRDQRLSLHWIKENIAAFGGDPDQITIWGQSAGAGSVGSQILAYDGRDDGLFHQAIMESGGPLSLNSQTDLAEESWNLLLEKTDCHTSCEPTECLRGLSFEDLNSVINTTELSGPWRPKIDNDLIARHSSRQLADGNFVKIPIIIGDNTDEGTSFAPKGLNATGQFLRALESDSPPLNSSFAQQIVDTYTEESTDQILANQAKDWVPPPSVGALYRPVAAYYGDSVMIAPRRLATRTWAQNHLPVWSYRFNAIPAWATYLDGATHFVEVAFAMRNLDGVGYPPIRVNPFEGLPESYRDLARLMSSDLIKFIATGDPNGWKGRDRAAPDIGEPVPRWPQYGCGAGKNFVYEGNKTHHIESDTYRLEAIDLVLSGNLDVYDR
ncbi:Alpha/Beta hydrolase protein [Emericellopsis atlantica]|uniref:Carboxylic ester hydrolase n=1 Tax=Emericellopsis atlantica TaxID=2614577 RepID=A0A9P8CND0_9HYPO|nr:Alpha/Beta hydrolase protein [Emericellopsis atlantica]KAG9253017.1 Alpha/Beta hydrolase protein [Emericellopsis atlantica]